MWRPAAIVAICIALVVSALAIPPTLGPDPAYGMQAARNGERVSAGTPVPVDALTPDPLDGTPPGKNPAADPLDGDPLDGPLTLDDPGAPEGQTRFAIERSGRPDRAPRSDVAYDDDPATVWAPTNGDDPAWLWLDVGVERRLRAVRWLARGSGAIEVAISRDQQRWETVERVDVGRAWDGIALRDDARYVRLTLLPGDGGEVPEIAEVAVYGRDRSGEVSREQEAKERRKRPRERKQRGESRSRQEAARDGAAGEASGSEATSGDRVRISTKRGETTCRGKRARCQAREGKVSVEEDCAASGTCTIDVRADGGMATCDAAGGERNRAGGGEGKRGGDGGECEAVANGGAVTIGDINP